MFSLTVRDHFMIAHSCKGAIFGPAQKTHGATYIVDVSFMREALDAHNLVVDIVLAGEALETQLAALDMRNLDDEEAFSGDNTTTEFLARTIFDRMAAAIQAGDLGDDAQSLQAMKVTLAESHIAWASYEGRI